MIRGIQKRIIVCKPSAGSRFECAYFVLRDGADAPTEDRDAMMREVKSILAESERKKKKKSEPPSPSLRRAVWLFLGGAVCGALPFAMLLIFS